MKKKIIILLFVIFVVIMVIIPYGKVEHLTSKYKAKFSKSFLETGWMDEDQVTYYKVLDYSHNKSAKIYYLYGGEGGFLLYMEFDNGIWKMNNWKKIWPFMSEDGFIWPYYW